MENETEKRIKDLENLMVEHRHNGIDSTSQLENTGPLTQYETTGASITPLIRVSCVDITALASAVTINNPSGTGFNFQRLTIRIKDNGSARAITWGSNYVAGGVALPSTTVAGKILTLGFMFNTANSLNKWMLVGAAQEV